MKSEMTERDKKLLTFMFMVVIIVGIGYWGVRPQIKRFLELGPKIQAQENAKSVNQLKMANVLNVEDQVEEYTEKIAERKDEFYQILSSSEVDRMMTEMALENNLEIYELSFNMPDSPTGRTAYQYSELRAWQEEMSRTVKDDDDDDMTVSSKASDKDSDDEDAGDKTSSTDKMKVMEEIMVDESEVYQANTDIYAVPITITVAGELSDLEAFKNDILSIEKRTLLTSYSWGEYREVVTEKKSVDSDSEGAESGEDGVTAEEESYQIITRKTLTVQLEIYMCDTSNIESEEDSETSEESAETEEVEEGSDDILDTLDSLTDDE